jgi:hypothetical protein
VKLTGESDYSSSTERPSKLGSYLTSIQ